LLTDTHAARGDVVLVPGVRQVSARRRRWRSQCEIITEWKAWSPEAGSSVQGVIKIQIPA